MPKPRVAIVSPFIDTRLGTERSVAGASFAWIFLVVSGEPSLAMVGPAISRTYTGPCFFAGDQLSGRGCDPSACCLRAIAGTHERAVAVPAKPVEYVA